MISPQNFLLIMNEIQLDIGFYKILQDYCKIQVKVAYTSGRKCLYFLVNYFYRNFECILMKPQINLFQN